MKSIIEGRDIAGFLDALIVYFLCYLASLLVTFGMTTVMIFAGMDMAIVTIVMKGSFWIVLSVMTLIGGIVVGKHIALEWVKHETPKG